MYAYNLFAKQNSGSGDCSSLVRAINCYRVLVNEVHCRECDWKAELRSQTLVNETRWLSDSLRDLTYNIYKLRTSRPVHWTRRHISHVQRTVSHWFHGVMSKFDIDIQELLIINAIRRSLLPLIKRCYR